MDDLFVKDEIKQVPTLYAPGYVGQFASHPENKRDTSCFYWEKCREQFAKKFQANTRGFFYSVDYANLYKTPDFIRQTERILNIKNNSVFYKTNRRNAVYIKVSDFWKVCYIRRSLFTLVCRLGLVFDHKNWDKFMFGEAEHTGRSEIDDNYNMARQTNKALLRFFFGYTKYTGDLSNSRKEFMPEKHGWVAEFSGKPLSYIKSVLVLENKENNPLAGKYVFGEDVLLS